MLREQGGDALFWRAFAGAIDNAQRSLGTADLPAVRRYATLAEGSGVALAQIVGEYERSVAAILAITEQRELLEGTPTLAASIRLRNPYVDALANTINKIAAGVQTTG